MQCPECRSAHIHGRKEVFLTLIINYICLPICEAIIVRSLLSHMPIATHLIQALIASDLI